MMPQRFPSFTAAFLWARVNAAEHCHAFQRWRVIQLGREYAVGVYSRNTGRLEHFCT